MHVSMQRVYVAATMLLQASHILGHCGRMQSTFQHEGMRGLMVYVKGHTAHLGTQSNSIRKLLKSTLVITSLSRIIHFGWWQLGTAQPRHYKN